MSGSGSSGRRWGRRLLVALVALVALAVLATGAALVWINTGPGKRWVIGEVRHNLPGLRIAAITGMLPWHARLDGVTIDDIYGDRVITARAVEARLRLLPLTRHRVVLTELDLFDLDLRVAPERDGVLNIRRLQPPAPPQPPSPWRIVLDRLELEGARIAWDDLQGRKLTAALSVAGDLEAGAGRPPRMALELRDVVLVLTRAELTLTAAGPLAWGDRVHAALSGRITGPGARGPWHLDASGSPAELAAELRADAGDAGRLEASLRGSAAGAERPFSADVSLTGIDPALVVPTLPRGTVTARLVASGVGTPLAAGSRISADVRITRSRVGTFGIDGARLALDTHGGAWDLRAASGHGPGWEFRASGSGAGAAMAASLDARASDIDLPLAAGPLRATGRTALQVRRAAGGSTSVEGSVVLDRARYGEYAVTGINALVDVRGYPTDPTGSLQFTAARVVTPRADVSDLTQRVVLAHHVADVRGQALVRALAREPLRFSARLPLASTPAGLRLDRTGQLSATARVTGLSAAALAALGGSSAVTAGSVDLALEVSGSAAAPAVLGRASLVGGRTGSSPDLAGDVGLTLTAALAPAPATTPLAEHSLHGVVRLDGRLVRDDPGGPRRQAIVSAEARLSGTAGAPDVTLEASGRDLRGGPRSLGTMELSAALAQGSRGMDVTAALATRGSEIASVHVFRPRAGAASTALTRGSLLVRAPDLAAVLPPWLGAAGSLDALVSLDRLGPVPEGRVFIDAGKIAIQGRPLGDVHVDGTLGRRDGRLQLALEQGSGSLGATLSLVGDALRGEVRAKNADLTPLRPVMEAAKRLAGSLDGDLVVSGRLERDASGIRLLALDHAELQHGRFGLVAASPKGQAGTGQEAKPPKVTPEEAQRKHAEVRAGGLALTLRRLEVKDTELDLADAADETRPVLRVHGIAATLENYSNRPSLARGRPAVFALRAEVERTGEMTAFATLDPLDPSPTLAGQANIEVALDDLRDFVAAKSGIQTVGGWFSCFVQFKVSDGRVTGGIKPIVLKAEVAPAHEGIVSRLKTFAADLGLTILSDRAPGRDAVASVVPIEGRLGQSDVQMVPAVLGLVHNAFVVGLASGFSYLPPVTAEQRQSLAAQAAQALSGEQPPRAQPPAEGGRGGG